MIVEDEIFTSIETGFNVSDLMPGIGPFSSSLRVVVGIVQAVAGAVIGLISLMGYMIHGEEYKEWVVLGVNHSMHGVMNSSRGIVEFVYSFFDTITRLCDNNGFGYRCHHDIDPSLFTPFFGYTKDTQPFNWD